MLIGVQKHVVHTCAGNRAEILRLLFFRKICELLLRPGKTPEKVIVLLPHQGLEQRLFAVVVTVKRTCRHPCFFHDIPQGSRFKPLFEKLLHRRRKDQIQRRRFCFVHKIPLAITSLYITVI